MSDVLTTSAEVDHWPRAPVEEALSRQKPAPDDVL